MAEDPRLGSVKGEAIRWMSGGGHNLRTESNAGALPYRPCSIIGVTGVHTNALGDCRQEQLDPHLLAALRT